MSVKRISIVILIVLAVMLGVYFFLRNAENRDYKKRGTVLIEKIEAYKQQHGKLPNSVSDLGLKESMNDGPYYEKKDSLNYIVFFNIGFDNTKIYYSKSKEWKDEP